MPSQMKPTITAFANSPDRGRGLARDMQVRWALEEVGQPYDVRLVTFAEQRNETTGAIWRCSLSNQMKSYHLVLFERSGAIVLHIAETRAGRGAAPVAQFGHAGRISGSRGLCRPRAKRAPVSNVGSRNPGSSYRRQANPAGATRRQAMRVMVLVKATEDSEKGILPTPELLAAMGKFNEELTRAGVMKSGDGLKPSSKGKRVKFDGLSRMVTDGPFAETKEVIAGFWLWEVADMDEAVAWVKRCPNPMPGPSEIEIRPLYEMADFQ